jgi:sorting nexin-8
MSLFGTDDADDSPSMHSSFARSRHSLFDEPSMTRSNSNSLFNDDDVDSGAASPWDMPTPRKQQNRVDLLRNLLPASDAPDGYIEVFDKVVRTDGSGGKIGETGISRIMTASKLDPDQKARIMGIVAPESGDGSLGRNEFNVLLALIGLAQEGETASLDGVDERRRSMYLVLGAFELLSYR